MSTQILLIYVKFLTKIRSFRNGIVDNSCFPLQRLELGWGVDEESSGLG